MDSEVRLRTKPYDKRYYLIFFYCELDIYICKAVLLGISCSKFNDWLALNRDNMSEWSDMPKESANRVDIIPKVNVRLRTKPYDK
jgi:hypothetical protein